MLYSTPASLTPEQAYRHQIIASGFYVMRSLEAHDIKPDTSLRTSMLFSNLCSILDNKVGYNSWKLTEESVLVNNRDTGKKVGFVLTQHGEILDYLDYGNGLVHDDEYPRLPIVKETEFPKSNIMKNEVILGLSALCVEHGINSKVLRIKK